MKARRIFVEDTCSWPDEDRNSCGMENRTNCSQLPMDEGFIQVEKEELARRFHSE